MRLRSLSAWTVSMLFVLAVGVVFAQTMSQTNATGDEQLKAVTQQMLQAARQADKDAVGRFLADNLTWVMPTGKVASKEGFLAELSTPPQEVNVEQIRTFGRIGLVTGVAHFENNERDARFLAEWVNEGGEWKLMAHQATLIGSPSGTTPTGTSGAMSSSGMAGGKKAASAAGRSAAPTLHSDDERAIWKVQEDLQRAYLKGDTAAYSKLTAEDYLRVEENGQQLGKSEFLKTVKKNAGQSPGRIETSDVQITVNGDAARVIMTLWGAQPGGEEIPATRVTRIFVKQNGRWQQAGAAFTSIREQ